ncbi:MAG: type I 3-dehydroquinate dehydratase [Bacteroidia bacterium]|nr:type I 3-dehydroquinate dehydratase [Bacteroidia bacterium]
MICVSIAEKDIKKCLTMMHKVDLAEIRLDLTTFTFEEIKQIFSASLRLIATCRPGRYSEIQRSEILLTAVKNGAAFVDIETEASEQYKKNIILTAKKNKCKIMVSYHNYESTPDEDTLQKIIKNGFRQGADIMKIACRVNVIPDCATLFSLYRCQKPLIAIGMGALGRITRIAAPYLGAPFTYASFEEGKETADGQIDFKTLKHFYKILVP